MAEYVDHRIDEPVSFADGLAAASQSRSPPADAEKDPARSPLAERFFGLSIDLLCCLGFSGRFSRLSPSGERTLNFSREELMMRPFIEFVHPDDRDPCWTRIATFAAATARWSSKIVISAWTVPSDGCAGTQRPTNSRV